MAAFSARHLHDCQLAAARRVDLAPWRGRRLRRQHTAPAARPPPQAVRPPRSRARPLDGSTAHRRDLPPRRVGHSPHSHRNPHGPRQARQRSGRAPLTRRRWPTPTEEGGATSVPPLPVLPRRVTIPVPTLFTSIRLATTSNTMTQSTTSRRRGRRSRGANSSSSGR